MRTEWMMRNCFSGQWHSLFVLCHNVETLKNILLIDPSHPLIPFAHSASIFTPQPHPLHPGTADFPIDSILLDTGGCLHPLDGSLFHF